MNKEDNKKAPEKIDPKRLTPEQLSKHGSPGKDS